MWPFTRTIVHRIEGMEDLVAALRENAAARRYQGECVAGLVEPKAEAVPAAVKTKKETVSPEELIFREWVDAQGFPENQRNHYLGMFAVLIGRNPAPPHFSREKCLLALESAGAPVPNGFKPDA